MLCDETNDRDPGAYDRSGAQVVVRRSVYSFRSGCPNRGVFEVNFVGYKLPCMCEN